MLQCISMSRHHHYMDSTLENENLQTDFFHVATLAATHDIDNNDVRTSSRHHQKTAASAGILGFLKCEILASFLGPKT